MNGNTFDVVVAGGGLSGLAVAEAILRRAPGSRVLCLEARARTGGCIRTLQRDGFVMEAGPAGFLDRSGAIRRLSADLGLERELIRSSDREQARWVRRGGRLHRFPASAGTFLTSRLLSSRGKLRMLVEPLRPAEREAEQTVGAFATRRLGAEAARLLVDPIVSGIYAADAAQVSLEASMPQWAALARSNRSLLAAFLRSAGRVQPLLSFRHGCEQLVDALRRRVVETPGGSIRCRAPVEALSVERSPAGFAVRVGGARPAEVLCRAFVSAAPASAASRFVSPLDTRIAWQLAQVRYASVAVLSLGYRREDVPAPLRGFGYLVPSCEGSAVLGVQWSSSIYPGNRAPEGACQLRLFVGGARHPTLAREAEADLLALAADELRRTLGVRAPPLAREVHRHLGAMPQYLPQHRERVADIERRSRRHPGLYIGGNGLRGLGMDSLVADAESLAGAVARHLEASPRPSAAPVHAVRTGDGSTDS